MEWRLFVNFLLAWVDISLPQISTCQPLLLIVSRGYFRVNLKIQTVSGKYALGTINNMYFHGVKSTAHPPIIGILGHSTDFIVKK